MTNKSILNLVVVAHPDDEVLGFGATGAALASKGELIQPVILCASADARRDRPPDPDLHDDIFRASEEICFCTPVLGSFPNLRMNIIPHLELVKFIENQIEVFRPKRIFTHHPRDLNDDHVCVAKAAMAAARLGQRRIDVSMIDSLHFMEVPSATDWGFPGHSTPFEPNLFIDVENTIERKIQALSCYRKVMRKPPHPRSREVLLGIAAYRGGQSGYRYAEAFQTVFQKGL